MISHPRIAVAVAALGLAAACRAQGPLAPTAAPQTGNAPASDVQYDTYYEPFDDNPVERLRDVAPLPIPTPLFDAYDPAKGLAQNVQTSRVVRTNRAVFAFPVLTVKVGQVFDIPFYYKSAGGISGDTVRAAYLPDKIQPIGSNSDKWSGSTALFTDKYQESETSTIFAVVEYSPSSFTGPGVLFVVRAKALAVGESPIQVHDFDAADDVSFDHVRSLVRDGLVTIQP